MTKPLKNVSASVLTRLLQHSKERNEPYQLLLVRYVNERLLYRLAHSAHAPNFVLKGATLFILWTGSAPRATQDLDFLGFGASDEEHIRNVVADVIATPAVDDGVLFDATSLTAQPIRTTQEYGGVRVSLNASVGTAKVRVQIDVGFGDAITPGAVEVDFPVVLADFPKPHLRTYPRETVVAEKLDAIVQLGLGNTRMKDFYDLKLLSDSFAFDGLVLVAAIRATFKRRATQLPTVIPPALTKEFTMSPVTAAQWNGFVRKTGAKDASDLVATVDAVTRFCSQPLQHAAENSTWAGRWTAGGPWQG